MFVLSPAGPTFDLETKKSFFCRVSGYSFSDGGIRFSQFGLFHTVLKRHFSVRRSNFLWPRDPGCSKTDLDFPQESFRAPYLVHSRSVFSRDTKLASLLRMLTVAELFAHSEFYAKHPQLEDFAKAARYTLPSLITIFLSHKKAEKSFNGNFNNVAKAIEILAQETAKPYVYSSPYNILALAFVIGQPTFAVYPALSTLSALSMKLATHGFYFPRKAVVERSNLDDIKSNAIYVTWTRTNLLPIKPWQPNHFVLLRTQNQFTPVRSYAKAAAAANYKKPSRTSSSRPETEDSHLSKVK